MMMEGASNGGMLYHEVQESKLCAVHCVNTVLQGPFFSEFDLAALASDLDCKERQMMMLPSLASGDFLSHDSHNVSLDGDFSIQVLQKALEVWDLQVIPLDSPVAEPAQIDPELENAFICHLQDHWFCIRKVNGEWYNFDSLYAAPQHLSKFYLAAYLDSLKGFGWSIFLVRGNFPKEFPISSSEASNGFGQWLSPEDAERIIKSCSSVQAPQRVNNERQQRQDQFLSREEADMFSEMEDEDLKAAIAASLMDSAPAVTNAEASSPQIGDQSSKQGATTVASPLKDQHNKTVESIEAGVVLSDQSNKHGASMEAASSLQIDQNNQEVASTVGDSPQDENKNKENTV
ncbi:ataxin-3 homolog [Lotus japonicus]|uniref:ataxin-3 homolog n=1 Tax=Lotus japonicus TaxID=34305 RepID=UPI00258A4C6D|nr:ataxin-3 homolog [Lotus japonicus]